MESNIDFELFLLLLTTIISGIAWSIGHYFEKRKRISEFKYQRANKIIEWGQKSLKALSDTEHLLEESIITDEKCRDLLSNLSYLTESGRLFFLNENPENQDKFIPYKGTRALVLDFLVSAYFLLKENYDTPIDARKIDGCDCSGIAKILRRAFLSALRFEISKSWGEKGQRYDSVASRGEHHEYIIHLCAQGEEVASKELSL